MQNIFYKTFLYTVLHIFYIFGDQIVKYYLFIFNIMNI